VPRLGPERGRRAGPHQRPPRRARGRPDPGERRVAELAASGLSNKQVAEQLPLSVYTVQAHLSRVYAKLGVGSRTQLARRLGAST